MACQLSGADPIDLGIGSSVSFLILMILVTVAALIGLSQLFALRQCD